MTPDGYLTPAGFGLSEFSEKRSRFIGRVWHAESEAEAMEHLRQTRAEQHDARHNCWCWLLRSGEARASDDGEPQGTAGTPMLECFRRAGVFDVCCVVTRYFGGVLLGPGGLLRAYTRAAKDALAAAGLAEARLWREMPLSFPYHLLERVRLELAAHGGREESADYGAEVFLLALLPPERADGFSARLSELSGGSVSPRAAGERFLLLPREESRSIR